MKLRGSRQACGWMEDSSWVWVLLVLLVLCSPFFYFTSFCIRFAYVYYLGVLSNDIYRYPTYLTPLLVENTGYLSPADDAA